MLEILDRVILFLWLSGRALLEVQKFMEDDGRCQISLSEWVVLNFLSSFHFLSSYHQLYISKQDAYTKL